MPYNNNMDLHHHNKHNRVYIQDQETKNLNISVYRGNPYMINIVIQEDSTRSILKKTRLHKMQMFLKFPMLL